jgi:hypothetical protein
LTSIDPPAVIPYHTPPMLALRLKQSQASGIFPKSLLKGDTPRRDKWRKTLARWADAMAVLGAIAVLTGLAGWAGPRRASRRHADAAGTTRPS